MDSTTSISKARREELRTFLHAHRTALSPEKVGLAKGRRRLTPGLRREEVAALAGVGLSWYTWLEQGRDINVSRDTLHRIARALELTRADEEYLVVLAGATVQMAPPLDGPLPKSLLPVIDGFAAGPAMVFGPTQNVLAYNRHADAVFDFAGYEGPFANNHLWRGMMDPARRRLYSLMWDIGIRKLIGLFRLHAAPYIGQPGYDDLVQRLCAQSPEFVELWNERETRQRSAEDVAFLHPVWGVIRFSSVRFLVEGFPGLVFFLPPADDATRRCFEAELASSG